MQKAKELVNVYHIYTREWGMPENVVMPVGSWCRERYSLLLVLNTMSKHVDAEDKGTVAIRDTLGGVQRITLINESGLYSLILSSKLPQAKVIHKMEPAWEKVQGLKFQLSSRIYQLPNVCSAGRFFDLKVQSVALQSLCESVAFSNRG